MNRFMSRTLIWDGHQGMATVHLAHVPLLKAPRINGTSVLQIDYMPLVGVRLILDDVEEGWRRLTDEECADIDHRLTRMLQVGLSIWE